MLFRSLKPKTACLGYIITYGWSVGSIGNWDINL